MTTSIDNRRCRKIFDVFQTIPKDFQPISRIIKEFLRCSYNFLNVKKIESLFNRFLSSYTRYCQLGVRNWSECARLQILDPQVWDSRIMCESWQVYTWNQLHLEDAYNLLILIPRCQLYANDPWTDCLTLWLTVQMIDWLTLRMPYHETNQPSNQHCVCFTFFIFQGYSKTSTSLWFILHLV